jgi:hypothetical protein
MIRRERQALRTRQAFAGPPWRFWGRTDDSRPYPAAEASENNIHWATETPPSTGVIPYFINRLYGSYFTNHIADALDIDLAKVVSEKIDANAKKYPVDKSWGTSRKYTEL